MTNFCSHHVRYDETDESLFHVLLIIIFYIIISSRNSIMLSFCRHCQVYHGMFCKHMQKNLSLFRPLWTFCFDTCCQHDLKILMLNNTLYLSLLWIVFISFRISHIFKLLLQNYLLLPEWRMSSRDWYATPSVF